MLYMQKDCIELNKMYPNKLKINEIVVILNPG